MIFMGKSMVPCRFPLNQPIESSPIHPILDMAPVAVGILGRHVHGLKGPGPGAQLSPGAQVVCQAGLYPSVDENNYEKTIGKCWFNGILLYFMGFTLW